MKNSKSRVNVTVDQIKAGADELRQHCSDDCGPILPYEEVIDLVLRATFSNLRVLRQRAKGHRAG